MPPFYQNTYGLLSAEVKRAGQPEGLVAPKCHAARCVTTAINFGGPVEWVSRADKSAKAFDGVGTIAGFAVRRLNRLVGAGIAIGDDFDIAYEGLMWVTSTAVLTVGAAYPGVVNSEVLEVSTDGAQNLARVQFNMPAYGPALV